MSSETLAYPQFTSLDLVGPHYMLGSLMGATVMASPITMLPVPTPTTARR